MISLIITAWVRLRVYLHVIGRRFIAKQFVPTFARINGNTAHHDSATPSLKHNARNAHRPNNGSNLRCSDHVNLHPPIKNREEPITATITEPEPEIIAKKTRASRASRASYCYPAIRPAKDVDAGRARGSSQLSYLPSSCQLNLLVRGHQVQLLAIANDRVRHPNQLD